MNKPESLRIGFVGDIALGYYYYNQHVVFKKGFFKEMSTVWDDCIFVAANFEGTMVTEYPDPMRPNVKLQVPGSLAKSFSNTPLKVMTCANNHILDSGSESLLFTIDTLRKAGIFVFGAGANREEANTVYYQKYNGYHIAWIGGCGLGYAQAGNNKAGAADLSKRRLSRAVKSATSQSDLIIVVLHADFEF
jgi:poly-gamma-glutamate capsule biosynthesis protein CapA/YwtB (metallophosphatase superfamily)